MLQVGRDSYFREESLRSEYGAQVRIQDLQRDTARMSDVTRDVDGGHSAAPDLAFDLVPTREGNH